MAVKILIADDHEVVRVGLARLFEGSNIEIVAQAATGDEAVDRTIHRRPDVVLLDVRMPGQSGLEALEKIHKELPATQVVMYSTFDNPTYVARSIALGAQDYILKSAGRDELIMSITRAAAGQPPATTSLMNRIAQTMSRRQSGPYRDVPLTNRETQVLRHVALGLSNKEISSALEISVETVKEHVQNILRKLDVTDRTQAAVWAVRSGLA